MYISVLCVSPVYCRRGACVPVCALCAPFTVAKVTVYLYVLDEPNFLPKWNLCTCICSVWAPFTATEVPVFQYVLCVSTVH